MSERDGDCGRPRGGDGEGRGGRKAAADAPLTHLIPRALGFPRERFLLIAVYIRT